jgi:hypothetical protein
MADIDLKEAQKAAKTDKKSKKASKERATDEKTTKAVKEKVAKEKDVMYQYEPGMDGAAKKKFRAAARRQKAAFQRDIKKEKDAEKKAKLIKKANKWAAETYAQGHEVTFGKKEAPVAETE